MRSCQGANELVLENEPLKIKKTVKVTVRPNAETSHFERLTPK